MMLVEAFVRPESFFVDNVFTCHRLQQGIHSYDSQHPHPTPSSPEPDEVALRVSNMDLLSHVSNSSKMQIRSPGRRGMLPGDDLKGLTATFTREGCSKKAMRNRFRVLASRGVPMGALWLS